MEIAWIVAAVAGVLALALAARVGTEAGRTGKLRKELEEERREARSLKKHLDKQAQALRKAEAELERRGRQGAREKKQAVVAKGTKGERVKANARVRELEGQVADAAQQVATLERQLAEANHAWKATAEQATATRVAAERSEERISEEAQRLAEAARVAEGEEVIAARSRVSEAEASAQESALALKAAEHELVRLRERATTQETLYVSIRSELSVKKDQIKQQREELERLRAIQVAWGDGSAAADPQGPLPAEAD